MPCPRCAEYEYRRPTSSLFSIIASESSHKMPNYKPPTLPTRIFFRPPRPHNKAIKDAREVVSLQPAGPPSTVTTPLDSPPDGVNVGDTRNVSPGLSTPAETGAVVEAGVATDEGEGEGMGRSGEVLNHVERLEVRAAEIMEEVVALAVFCERVGASKDLEVGLRWWDVGHGRRRRLFCGRVGRGVVFADTFYLLFRVGMVVLCNELVASSVVSCAHGSVAPPVRSGNIVFCLQ